MAHAIAVFDHYKIDYLGRPIGNMTQEARIFCYQGTNNVGRIEFHKNTVLDAELSCKIVNDQPWLRFRVDRFADIYRLLLNEKPLSLFANDSTGVGMVTTSEHEPVGQEE